MSVTDCPAAGLPSQECRRRHDFDIVFFDMGNIFISDDPAASFLYRKLYSEIGGESRMTVETFFAQRAEHILAGGDLWTFVRKLVPPESFEACRRSWRGELYSEWEKFSPEIPGTADAARELSRHYRLGIIANQPVQAEALLHSRGLRELFDVCAISDAVGFSKPDPRLFRHAMDLAGVKPERTLMIGDRIDNDVAPAQGLGMKTLWYCLGFEQRAWRPRDSFEQHYVDSIGRASVAGQRPGVAEAEPDFVAGSPRELVDTLLA